MQSNNPPPGRRRVLGMLAAISIAPVAGCATRGFDEAISDDTHATAQALATRHRLCRLAFATVRGRRLDRVEAVSGCGQEATPDDVFEAASLGKPVFAAAVLQLAEQGGIDLDAPVMHYLPHGYAHRSNPFRHNGGHIDQVSDPRLARVTSRMLLNHTAGLPNWAREPLVFNGEPGGTWHYSGEGYTLLQRAVEEILGAPLDRFMAERVFLPLGMTRTSYPPNGQPVTGHAEDGQLLPPSRFDTAVAAATLLTTARDYGCFLAALLQDERRLHAIQASPAPINNSPGLAWGLGWGLASAGAQPLFWHWGNNPGFRAFVIAAPDSGDALVLFTDSERGLLAAHDLTRTVLPAPRELFAFPMLR